MRLIRPISLLLLSLLLVHAAALPVAGPDEDDDGEHRRQRRQRRQTISVCAPAIADGAPGCGCVWHRYRVPLHSDAGTIGAPISVKIIIVAGLVAVIVSLFSALYYLYRDRGHGTRMVKALTIRVGLSISLIAFLLLSYWMGWITPQALR